MKSLKIAAINFKKKTLLKLFTYKHTLINSVVCKFIKLWPVAAWLCPLRLTIDPVQIWSFIQGAVGSWLGLRHPTHPGVVWPHGLRPHGRRAGGAATERSNTAVGHVEILRRWRPLLLPADDADESPTQQKQQGGDPAYVDGGAHLPLQGLRHQGIVVDCSGDRCRPAGWDQTQDACCNTKSSTQETCLEK